MLIYFSVRPGADEPCRGGDMASHWYPLFRSEAMHTTICGVAQWWAVADPRQGVACLCVEDPRLSDGHVAAIYQTLVK